MKKVFCGLMIMMSFSVMAQEKLNCEVYQNERGKIYAECEQFEGIYKLKKMKKNSVKSLTAQAELSILRLQEIIAEREIIAQENDESLENLADIHHKLEGLRSSLRSSAEK